MRPRTTLARGLARAFARSGFEHATDLCDAAGVKYHWWMANVNREDEPLWLRNLRAIRRVTGCTWEDLFGR